MPQLAGSRHSPACGFSACGFVPHPACAIPTLRLCLRHAARHPPSAQDGGVCHDDEDVFHDPRCSRPDPRYWFCAGARTGSRQLWIGQFTVFGTHGTIVRCRAAGVRPDFLVCPGQHGRSGPRIDDRHRRRRRRRVGGGCTGDHGRHAEFNGMDCRLDLSIRSGGVRLLPDDAIAAIVGALNAAVRLRARFHKGVGR
jgi:hypothetical protein